MSTKTDLTIIVMGLDKDGKPRAGAYPADMADVAAKDATIWKLRFGRAGTDAAKTLAKEIPNGRLFPSAKMQLPIIKRETYDLLVKMVKCDAESAPAAAATASDLAKTLSHNPWDTMVQPGATVLYCEVKFDGWFECIVKSISADKKTVRLKWRDYKDLPEFDAPRNSLGLLCKVK